MLIVLVGIQQVFNKHWVRVRSVTKKKKIVDEKQVALSKENRREKETDPAHGRVGCGGSVFEKRVV